MKTVKIRTRLTCVLGWLAIAVTTTAANAAGTTEQAMLNCTQMQNDALRLACFDQLVKGEQSSAPTTPVAPDMQPPKPVTAPPAAIAPVTAPPVNVSSSDSKSKVRDVLIVKLGKNAYGKWLFYFDTGEVWKQSGSGKITLSESTPIAAQLSSGFIGNKKLHLAQRRQPIKVTKVESGGKDLANDNPVVTEAPIEEDQPLQLINMKKNSLGRWLFYFDNGDVWKQADSKRLRLSATPPVSVRLSKGFLGNTRLHIDGHRQPIKVTLVRSDK